MKKSNYIGVFNKRLFLAGVLLVSLIGFWAVGSGLAAVPASFNAPVNYTAGTSPRGVAAADVNGDGIKDLIVANRDSANVSVMPGIGDGTYGAATNYPVLGSYPSGVAAADFNGDGKIDLAVTHQFSDGVSILMNNGNGTFAAPVDTAAGTYPYGIIADDLNKDGNVDLAVTSYNTSAKVQILSGNGNGTFAAPVAKSTGSYSTQVAAGDLNGDGYDDIVTANNNANNISVLIQYADGSGTFWPTVNYTAGTATRGVAIGDFNGDGKNDIAAANATTNNVSIFLNSGTGTFGAPVNYPVGSNLRSIATADFNGDGKTDLVVVSKTATNNISTLMGNGNGTFDAPVNYTGGNSPEGPGSVIATDLNSDGKADIAVANYTSGNASVLLNASPTCGKPALSLGSPAPFWASYADYTSGLLSVNYTISNGSGSNAVGVQVVGVANSSGVLLSTAAPVAVGNIVAGGTATVLLKYSLPSGVGSFQSTVYATSQDPCGAGYTYPAPYPGP